MAGAVGAIGAVVSSTVIVCETESVLLELSVKVHVRSIITLHGLSLLTDSCLNSSSISQTIRVEDTTAPSLPNAPENVVYECEDDVPAPGELTATDNCNGDITVTGVDAIDSSNSCNVIITRTWTFTDSSNNSDSVNQIITVKDTTAPVAPDAPESESYQCASQVPAAGN